MTVEAGYGWADRLIHRMALGGDGRGTALQRALADVEDTVAPLPASDTPPPAPVFVTALPRAGTTLLLTLLAEQPEFATHTYRDMPFVLCPWLWQRLSQPFHKPAALRQRAHGDGLSVGYDSPEAFEEIAWLAFWREKYETDRIQTWTEADRDDEFERFMARHMWKLIGVRARERGTPPHRYLSKNNANIARLPLLLAAYPDCRIVVPLRDPRSHAASLLRQHQRFSQLHRHDRFGRRYMTWLGHFEFGLDHRPIAFPSPDGDVDRLGHPETPDYWLRYWIAAHLAILDTPDPRVLLVDQAAFRSRPPAALRSLADALGLGAEHRRGLAALAGRVQAPPRPADTTGGDPRTERRAAELYDLLRGRCVGAAGSAAVA